MEDQGLRTWAQTMVKVVPGWARGELGWASVSWDGPVVGWV